MRRRKVLGIVLAAALALGCTGALAGCGSQDTSADTDSTTEAQDATTRVFVDDAGREVTVPVPDSLTSIYCSSPISEMYLLSLTPEKAACTLSEYSEEELKYLPDNVADLPNYGMWEAGGGDLNGEVLIANGVQLILSVSNTSLSQSDIDSANELQEQTGIPVVVFDGAVDKTPDTYRAVGDLLGASEQAEEKAAYLETIYNDVVSAVAEIPEADRVTVYYAEGPEGLKTEPENSPHFATFKAAGAIDVATCDLTKGSGMTEVSLENVIAWNPEVIIAWDDEVSGGADDLIRTSDDWSSIDAVINNRVYTIPCVPYMWGDRPPSVTRYIGMQWLANKLYPEVYDVDMVTETKNFYETIFDVTLTDDEAKDILFEL